MARELIASYSRKDFRMDTFCTGGPGGQNQNKNENGVRFTHLATGLAAESRTYKSYQQNRKAAFTKLAAKLQAHHERLLRVPHVRSDEQIRTYHAPDNRVVDHATGERMSYDEAMHKGIDHLILTRRRLS